MKVNFTIETLREEAKTVLSERLEIEYRDKSMEQAFFGSFGLSKIRPMEAKY